MKEETMEWENDLSVLFLQITNSQGSRYDFERLKIFISSLLSLQHTKDMNEIKEYIEKVLVPYEVPINGGHSISTQKVLDFIQSNE